MGRPSLALLGQVLLLTTCSACSDGEAPTIASSPPSDVAPPIGSDAAAPVSNGVDAAVPLDAGPAAAPAPWGCVSQVAAGHHVFTCDGLRYDVEISPACAKGGCGLVLDVHGLTMNANQLDKSTKLRALGAAHGFVVVQPTAASSLLGPSWNPSTDDDKVWSALDDVRRALLVDERRIHVTGFSQGGAMTWRLLCKHADVIASAAPVCGADAKTLDSNVPPFRLDCPFDSSVRPSRPLSILQMHGTKDGLVPFEKAKLQRDAALAWLAPDQEVVVTSDEGHVRTRYTSSTKNVVFEFLQHDYVVKPSALPVPVGGHCYPGGDDVGGSPATLSFSCAPPNAFVWGDVVIDFFEKHPKSP